jgi:hypothetical protein
MNEIEPTTRDSAETPAAMHNRMTGASPRIATSEIDERTGDCSHPPGLMIFCIRRRTLCIVVGLPVLAVTITTTVFLWQLSRTARLNAAIQARGGYTHSDYYTGSLPTAWLPWRAGRGSATQTDISLESCNVTDRWLATHDLSLVSGSLSINLMDNPITDDGLREIARYRRLNSLLLSETQITDAGLAYLRENDDLAVLFLNGTAVTDAGLAQLHGMSGLNTLQVPNTNVTSAGVLSAIEHMSLSSIAVDASVITPEIVTALDNKAVYHLALHGNAIPEALPLFANATGPKSLYLNGESVTDECVPDLTRLTGLQYLNLMDTRMTRDGYDQLRKALPNCHIYLALFSDAEGTE